MIPDHAGREVEAQDDFWIVPASRSLPEARERPYWRIEKKEEKGNMVNAGRLTKAQKQLLSELIVRSKFVAEYYPPAVILVRLGLAEWRGTSLAATQAGIAEWTKPGE